MVTTNTDLGKRDLTNALFAFALVGLGVLGFRTSFGGSRFLEVGLGAALLGIVAAAFVVRLRLSLLLTAAGSIVALALLGGFAVPDDALGGFLPSPTSFGALADGAANGWARLLTSQTPAGTAGNVLVVPLLCGYVGALVACLLARRLKRLQALCVMPPLGVLALSVLLGIDRPASLWLQGGVFAAIGIAWISVRESTRLEIVGGRARPGRFASAVAMLTAALALATVIGPNLPGAAASPKDRYVLRNEITPPFDPNDYPSPLAGYRRYIDEAYKKTKMIEVTSDKPLPAGTPIRLAVMDYFNGVVWSVGPQEGGPVASAAGTFQRVGTSIINSRPGDTAHVTIRVLDYNKTFPMVWVPMVGSPTSVRFSGPNSENLQKYFRFNRAGEVGADNAPLGLTSQDTYEITTKVRPLPASPRASFDDPGLPSMQENFLGDKSADAGTSYVKAAEDTLAATSGSDYDKANALAQLFGKGYYFDQSLQGFRVPPGHSLAHLAAFMGSNLLDGTSPIGDAEQYAAAMAVVSRMANAPARVVMGFRGSPQSRIVGTRTFTAGQMEAWVEINFRSLGWVPFYPTPDRKRTNERSPEPQAISEQKQEDAETPVTTPPPNISNIERTKAQKGKPENAAGGPNFLLRVGKIVAVVVGVPATATAIPILGLLLLKGRRRNRRRNKGTPSERVTGGWAEAVDLARDAGHPVPPRLTRRETAQLVGLASLAALADRADEFAFGATAPDDDDAKRFWTLVDDMAKAELGPLTFWQRLRVRANPTSLFNAQGERRRLTLSPKFGVSR